MTRTLTAAIAAIALSAGAAQARDFQIHFTNDDPAHLSARVTKAAETVCREAMRNGFDQDFGSLDDCVADTVATVRVASLSPTKIATK